MRRKTKGIVGAATACAALAAASAVGVSCTSSPVNVPVRTFERPQKIDVVCMQVYDNDGSGNHHVPTPVKQSLCAPVAAGVNGELLPYHLYALVTQTSRGEVAVVDLTGGYVVDTDHSTPGINFIPVGAQPTDIAVAPDAQMAFVAAAEPNKPALYGINAIDLLGDSQGLPPDVMKGAGIVTPTLPSLPACSLPQAPIAVNVVAREHGAYELLVTLAGTGGTDAQIVSVDPAPLLRGAGLSPAADAGSADGASEGGSDGGPVIAPGSLAPCILNPSRLVLFQRPVPAPVEAPVAWPDGVPYVDGGVDLRDAEPPPPSTCAVPLPPSDGGVPEAGGDGGALDGGVGDAGASDGGDAGMMGSADAGMMGASDAGDAGPVPPIASGYPRPRAVALDNQSLVLYVADGALPLIHAIDVSVPGVLRELPPLVATSVDDPTRLVSVGGLSISPPTRDLRRYLYAVDAKVGSIMVFDVTTPPTEPRPPMRRPHPELNPFQPSDRIAFSSPVAAVAFVRHDWPITKIGGAPLVAGRTGLLCNPSPLPSNTTLSAASPDEQLATLYGYGAGNQPVEIGPYRLRGVFAFATLTNGTVVTIDVDDWDAPCRRPDPMDGDEHRLSDLDVPQPAQASGELNPYHVPVAAQFANNALISNPVTDESFFPAAAPNRIRPNYLLRNDPNTGNHQPTLIGQPQLYSNQAALPTGGNDSLVNPAIRATFSAGYDPTFAKDPTNPDPKARGTNLPPGSPGTTETGFALPGLKSIPSVRLSLEVPDVHVDQDWTVTYEGTLPGFDGISAALFSDDDYKTLKMTAPQGFFCRKGIEDWDIGRERVAAELPEMDRLHIARPVAPDQWTADYVQIADDILDASNPYWGSQEEDNLWALIDKNLKPGQPRHDVCQSAYGSVSDQTPSVYRDFPILRAYDDQLIIGRFGYSDPNAPVTTNRQVVGSDPSNADSLRLAYLCFHHQASFRVRAGGEWVAVGSQSGFLHRIAASASGGYTDKQGNAHARCEMSCDARDALLNGRAPELPRPKEGGPTLPPDRNSPLAMRNPMFSFVMWGGTLPATVGNAPPPRTTSLRDYVWKFSTRGQLTPLTVPLASGTPQVDPQSMLFIESLGQLAVVDGASQGLVLIDLNIVAPAHAPYF